MDGAWRRPPKSLADYGHTEPKRGAEWWGKSPFGYFWGSFPKVTRRQGGTLSGRCRSNGYVHNPTVLTVRPPSQASQLPHLDRGASARSASPASPSREQAPSPQVQRHTKVVYLPMAIAGKPASTFALVLCQCRHAPGFTRFTGFSPANAAKRFSTAHLAIASRVSWVAEPICGVATTLFNRNNGDA